MENASLLYHIICGLHSARPNANRKTADSFEGGCSASSNCWQ